MENVIGYKGTPSKRLDIWTTMLESKKSYKIFSKAFGEQEQEIADLDKRLYEHSLSKYIAA